MLETKPILPEDWPLLKSVRLRALADAPDAFGTTLAEVSLYSDDEWQARAQRFSDAPPTLGCLALADEVPCGMSCAYPSEADSHAAGMTSFWVAPEHRGQGVADALVTFVANWAAAQGFAVLEADVVEDNYRAIAFYKRVGFMETGQSEPFRGNPSKRIVKLARRLVTKTEEGTRA